MQGRLLGPASAPPRPRHHRIPRYPRRHPRRRQHHRCPRRIDTIKCQGAIGAIVTLGASAHRRIGASAPSAPPAPHWPCVGASTPRRPRRHQHHRHPGRIGTIDTISATLALRRRSTPRRPRRHQHHRHPGASAQSAPSAPHWPCIGASTPRRHRSRQRHQYPRRIGAINTPRRARSRPTLPDTFASSCSTDRLTKPVRQTGQEHPLTATRDQEGRTLSGAPCKPSDAISIAEHSLPRALSQFVVRTLYVRFLFSRQRPIANFFSARLSKKFLICSWTVIDGSHWKFAIFWKAFWECPRASPS